ncbi:bacillolysin/thermolysin [Scopulibacillus darangshiensis]|uniref:Neutral metalloproteinase n=1 Tax=Scopulibacillus darangshiensis TaxID=442528 RepID=A0A4R2NM03_9BACL|nr:M4 family metallopeptidase [Scopulibacillus darangshiensis]TCP22325.1 bacillolysin/thermolysin [Scopulibacillus darangshiensis]
MKKWVSGSFATVIAAATIGMGGITPASAATAGDNALKDMKSMSKGHFQMVTSKENNVPTFVSGKLSKEKITSVADVKNYLKKKSDLFKMDPGKDLTFKKKTTDKLGMTHYEFQQTVKGVPVDDAIFTVHTNKAGEVTSVTGQVYPKATQAVDSVKAGLSKDEAVQKAWQHIDLTKKQTLGAKADGQKSLAFKSNVENTAEKSKLVVYPEKDKSALAYHVELQFIKPYPANWQIIVDANDGHIIQATNAASDATGSGTGVLGKKLTFNTTLNNGAYVLVDQSRGGGVETYSANNGSSLPGDLVSDADNSFTDKGQAAAVSAHYNIEKVYDYYKNNFNRNSYDNKGATLKSTVHYGNDYNNAFWNGQQMVYGDGDGRTFIPLSGSLDVTGHELTHAVTEYTAGLQYRSQPGALNESMSDVFGNFIEGNHDYLVGEDVYTPNTPGDALRSMSDPTKYGQPDNMSDYVHTGQDNGGVHTNSGIPNKAAYLTIESVGWDKAQKIYYRALTTYLSPRSQFSDARAALLQATSDLYGQGAEYNAVASAWDQVGVK